MAKEGLECTTCGKHMIYQGRKFWKCKDCNKLFKAEYEFKGLTEVIDKF
jgi:tRNA(Ile2) C34 agmatinyltransferase TiaS